MIELDYMYNNDVMTKILFDEETKKIDIINYTDDILHRAFGIKENVTYEDLIIFLEDRCFSKNIGNLEDKLKLFNIKEYDVFKIIEKTNGRTYEDDLYINISYKKQL